MTEARLNEIIAATTPDVPETEAAAVRQGHQRVRDDFAALRDAVRWEIDTTTREGAHLRDVLDRVAVDAERVVAADRELADDLRRVADAAEAMKLTL